MATRKRSASKTPRHLQGSRQSAPKKLTDEDVKAAVDVISAEYWQDVRGCAEDFVEQFHKGEFRDRDDFETQLHQYVDGSQRVIYTYWARLGLLATNNADAYEEATGEVPTGDSSGISTQMFYAFKADIEAQIGSDIDFDE